MVFGQHTRGAFAVPPARPGQSVRSWTARWSALVAIFCAVCHVSSAVALDVIGYAPTVNDRFASGFPSAPVPNTSGSFVGAGYEWRGVGWAANDPTKGFGFLTPRHFLATVHYGGAATIQLLDASGSIYSVSQASINNSGYGFTNGGTQPPDIAIGRITSPIAAARGLPRYGVLDLNSTSTTNSSYNGQSLLVYGRGADGTRSPRIGTASVNATFTSGSDINIRSNGSSVVLQVGDSGSPVFIPWTNPNGQAELTIIGNNAATNGSTLNVYNMLGNSGVIGAINALTTPDGYALRVVGNASGTWQGVSSTNLGNRGAWGLSAPASAPSDVYVLFNGATAGNGGAVTVNSAENLRGLSFKATGTAGDGFSFSGAGTLTIGRGGVTNYDGDRQVFGGPITLGDDQYWDVGSGGVTAGAIATNGNLLEIAGTGTARITGAVSGSGGLALSGSRLELVGSSNYTGPTWVHAGLLVVSGTASASSGVTVDASAMLGGTGIVAAIGGSGTVAPGASPGILTAPSIDASGGLDFAFEFTGTGSPAYGTGTASRNDVLRLTGTAPFGQSLTASNAIAVFLDVPSLLPNSVFRGGFFTDRDADFLAGIEDATFSYYVANVSGTTVHGGKSYSLYAGPYSFDVATVAETAAFAAGTEAGYVTQFSVVPEPAAAALLGVAIAGLAVSRAVRRRRRGRPRNPASLPGGDRRRGC